MGMGTGIDMGMVMGRGTNGVEAIFCSGIEAGGSALRRLGDATQPQRQNRQRRKATIAISSSDPTDRPADGIWSSKTWKPLELLCSIWLDPMLLELRPPEKMEGVQNMW